MCNPRKITARATRQIAEAWRTAIQRTARASGSVTGRASLTQRLGSMLAEPARRAFEQAVAADPRWQLTATRTSSTYAAARPDTFPAPVS